MMADRPSREDFFETGKAWDIRPLAMIALASCVAGRSVNVRPTAEGIVDRLEAQGSDDLASFLDRRGFSDRTFRSNHPYAHTHSCVEKANGTAMIWVGGVDVVRVCRETETDQIEVLHYHTHGVAEVLYNCDPQTGRAVCEDKSDIVTRCPE